MKWSFIRLKDEDKITSQLIEWEGPFSWPKFESVNDILAMEIRQALHHLGEITTDDLLDNIFSKFCLPQEGIGY